MTHHSAIDNRHRIALATTELAVGGAERCLVNLALGLDRRRFAPEVYSLRPAPDECGATLVTLLREAGIPVHFLNARSRWQFVSAIGRFRRLLVRQRPVLLQSFLFHANVVGVLAARLARVPCILTGIRVADRRQGRQRLERWLAGRVDRMVCVSQSVADFSREVAHLPAAKLVVIPNGIATERYLHVAPATAAQLGLRADRRVLLSIGRLDRQKGFDHLLQLASRFLPALPQHDLVIVGSGPESDRLNAQATALGLRDRVHLLGWKAPEQIPAILAASDVVLIPSRWEGMPNVLLEAMAAARPVVATAVEGVCEVLGPLAPRQTSEVGDDAEFVDRVVGLARPTEGELDWGTLNRERVAQHFSLAAMIGQYENLFLSLIEKQRARPS